MIEGVIIKKLTKNHDQRGWLVELFRQDELDFDSVMSYASLTNPGVIRGPHEHRQQSDCFAFFGPGRFKLYLWDARQNSPTKGESQILEVGEEEPSLVVVPPGVIHGYKCVSETPALCLNFPDKLYKGIDKAQEVDEIRWEEKADSPYKIE